VFLLQAIVKDVASKLTDQYKLSYAVMKSQLLNKKGNAAKSVVHAMGLAADDIVAALVVVVLCAPFDVCHLLSFFVVHSRHVSWSSGGWNTNVALVVLNWKAVYHI